MIMQPSDMTHTGVSKVTQYKWSVLDRTGVFLAIPKNQLKVDAEYQRTAIDAKILRIAAAWSWTACGVIIVADRAGEFFVVDGQHRVLAARKRSDISDLPCLVFETTDPSSEALGFLRANKDRAPIKSFDAFRAQCVAGDEGAAIMDRMITGVGRRVDQASGGRTFAALTALRRIVEVDRDMAERVFGLTAAICENAAMSHQMLGALFYIERNLPAPALCENPWRDRLIRLGPDHLMDGVRKAAGYFGKGGDKVWAKGVLDTLNKGLRTNRLSVAALADFDMS